MAQANVKLTVDATSATKALQGVQGKTTQLQRSFGGLQTAITGLGLGLLAKQAINTSANFEKLNVRLGLLTKSSGTFARSQELAAKAQKSFGLSATEALEGITDITARLQPLGVSVEEIKTTFFGFNTAAKLAGASAIESSNAFRQLAQALGSGRLQGDEFRSISEQIPTILKPVADELGTTVGELKKFSSEGKITSGVVIRALKKIETEGGASLQALLKNDPTQVFKNLSNETENLSRAFGDQLNPAILPVIRSITNLTAAFTEFINSPAGSVALLFTGIGVAIKGVSVVTPILSAQAIALGLKFKGLAVGSQIFTGQLIATKATLAATSVGFATATAAANAFKLALAKTGIGIAVIALGALAAKFLENKINAEASAKAAKEFDNNIKGIKETADNSALALNELAISAKEFKLANLKDVGKFGISEIVIKDQIKALKERNKILKGEKGRDKQIDKDKKFNDFIIENLKEQTKLNALINGQTEEEFNLQEQIRQLKEQFGIQDSEELIKQLQITEGLKKKLKLIKQSEEAAKALKEKFMEIGKGIEDGIVSNLTDAVMGTKTLAQAAVSVLNDLKRKLVEVAIQRAVSGIGNRVGGFLGGLFGGRGGRGGGGLVGNTASSFLGGVANPFARANGGPVSAGGAFVVGEKGPELLQMGSRGGNIIPNNQIGGGTTNIVNVSVDASGSAVSGNNQDAQALGNLIGAAIRAELIKEKRAGGLLSR